MARRIAGARRPTTSGPSSPLDTRCRSAAARPAVAYHSRRTVATLDGLVPPDAGGPPLPRRRPARCTAGPTGRRRRAPSPCPTASSASTSSPWSARCATPSTAASRRSTPQLRERGVPIAERSVTNLLDRYDELLALRLADQARLRARLAAQGQVILAIDGLQPDVGHEVLWVIRDCLSGEVLLARSLLSGGRPTWRAAARGAPTAVAVPIAGVVSDGQHSIRNAVARALPGVPHQLCQFHYLREAALPVYEADRHAKKELKKKVRGVRPIERAVEAARRRPGGRGRRPGLLPGGAQRPDRRRPAAAGGLRAEAARAAGRHPRLRSAGWPSERGGSPRELSQLDRLLARGLAATAALWPAIERGLRLGAPGGAPAGQRRRTRTPTACGGRTRALLAEMRAGRDAGGLPGAGRRPLPEGDRSYGPGLFHCYEVADLPRTNNDLEQLFGAARYHERRTTGRKVASPALVVRGSVRVVAAVATRRQPFSEPT